MADLRLQNVTKQYSGHTAVDAINLQIDPGEFVALLGPSGCGKTTTLRMIAGFVQPTHGSILVGGTDVTRMLPEQRNMGMVFQSYALFPHMTVRKNIEFGLQCRRISGPEANERIDRLG